MLNTNYIELLQHNNSQTKLSHRETNITWIPVEI